MQRYLRRLAHRTDIAPDAAGSGLTPLHAAIGNDDLSIARRLIAAGANVNARDGGGNTPLWCASTRAEVELLVAHGAIVNSRSNLGRTPLHWAALHDRAEAAAALIAHGADIDVKNDDGLTPLQEAVRLGGGAAAEVLRRHGAKE